MTKTTDPARAVSPILIRLFGPFEAYVRGAPLPHLRTRKGQWLLALLTLRHGLTVGRAWLADTLWPESAEARARVSLKESLKDLRGALGPEKDRLCAVGSRALRLDLTGAEVDVVAFDAAITRGDITSLEEAIALYRGPFLEGCTEDWAVQEREAREHAYLAALDTLARHASAGADHSAAERYLRLAIAADPYRETRYAALMQALFRSGNLGAAARVYWDLCDLLEQELDTEPDPDTRRIFEEIQTAARARVAASLPRQRPAAGARVSLPRYHARFIGREPECERIEAHLTQSRLVTLTGPPGAGKTRLAVWSAVTLGDVYWDAAYFVELAGLTDPALVTEAIAAKLGTRGEPGQTMIETLANSLCGSSLLLVLDNCEHVLDEVAVLVHALLKRVETLAVLATSRRPLGLPGEQEFSVPCLATPESADTPERLLFCESVQFFVERARSVRPDFRLTSENAKAVALLCARLDGLPLALELAAARSRVLSPGEMLTRLERPLELLAGRQRTEARHRSLRAALEWSFRLLPPAAQRFFIRLSVFRGGWSLEAAQAVCEEPHALDALEELVECSLVVAEQDDERTRYRLLEIVCEYGREKLVASGEAEAVRSRHLGVFLALAAEADAQILGTERDRGVERLERERDNLRAALDWARDSGDAAQRRDGLRLATTLWRFWSVRGYAIEGLRRLEELLALAPPAQDRSAARDRVTALEAAAALVRKWGCMEDGLAWLAEAEALCRQWRLKPERAALLRSLAGLYHGLGRVSESDAHFGEAVALQREIGDQVGLADSLYFWGIQATGERAQALLTECLAIRRAMGDRPGMASALRYLGNALAAQDREAARRHYMESLELCREIGHRDGAAYSLLQLGRLLRREGDCEGAQRCFGEMLEIWQEIGDQGYSAFAWFHLGLVAWDRADRTRAERSFQESRSIWLRIGNPTDAAKALYQLSRCEAEATAAADQRAQAVNERLQMWRTLIAELLRRAGHWLATSQAEQAARLLGATEAACAGLAATGRLVGSRAAEEEAAFQRAIGQARVALGEEDFAAAWEEGRAMTLEQVVLEALSWE
jgi:predicted ATPase/DNA-binding SARP family transcriptional activator